MTGRDDGQAMKVNLSKYLHVGNSSGPCDCCEKMRPLTLVVGVCVTLGICKECMPAVIAQMAAFAEILAPESVSEQTKDQPDELEPT